MDKMSLEGGKLVNQLTVMKHKVFENLHLVAQHIELNRQIQAVLSI